MITQGAPNTLVKDRGELTPLTPLPSMPGKYLPPTQGTHWIQAAYLDEEEQPVQDMSYTIETDNGGYYYGMLDAQGKTPRIEGLNAATATITFGEPEKLKDELSELRTELKQQLDLVMAGVKQQAAEDRAKLEKAGFFDTVSFYRKAIIEGTEEGFMGAIKSFFEGLGKHLAVGATSQSYKYAIMSGNQKLIEANRQAFEATMVELTRYLDDIVDDVVFLYDILSDAESRAMLYQFAESYIEEASALMITRKVANIAGGMIPAILLSLITGGMAAFPSISATAVANVSRVARKMVVKLTQLERTAKIEAAAVNTVHRHTRGSLSRKQWLNQQGFQLHHIIHQNKRLKQHKLWQLADADIESMTNKIFLPKTADLHPTRSLHSGRHLDTVVDEIEERMEDIVKRGEIKGWTQVEYKAELNQLLSEFRQELKAGNVALNKNARPWAY